MLVGDDAKLFRLEVGDVGEFRQRSKKRSAKIADESEVIHVFENVDVEQAVLDVRIAKEREGTAIEPAIADEEEGAFHRSMEIAFHAQLGRPFRRDLGGREEITQRAEDLFHLPVVALDNLRVEADAGHLDEEMAVGAGQVDQLRVSGADDLPRRDEIERDAEFHGEDIYRAEGQNSERDGCAAHAVDHLVDGAIAAGRDDGIEPLLDGALGLRLGVAGTLGGADDHVARQALEPFEPGPDAARRRIRDNTDAIQDWLSIGGCGRLAGMFSVRSILITSLVVAVVAAIAIAAGSVWLNSFIHSPAFKTEVEARASQSLGTPVTIDAIDFDIFHGVKLKGLATQLDPSHAGGQGALKVHVERVNCNYSLWDLFWFRLRLTGVLLEQPQVILTKAPSTPAPENSPPSSTASGSTNATTSTGGGAPGFQFVLDRAKISEGTFTVQDASGATTAEMKGIEADANTSGYYSSKDITGTLRVKQIAASNLQITDFRTPFTYRSNQINASPFDATAFNGRLAGDFTLEPGNPSILNFNGKGLDVALLTAATMSNSSAKLSGSLDLQSKWRAIESGDFNGEGDAQLSDGKLQGVKILEEVGRLLRINELVAPIITKAQTHFVVHDRATKFIGLQVDSPLFKLSGSGTVGFDGQINADLVLGLTRDAMDKLPSEARGSFVHQPDGSGSISFRVTGTTSNPQTNLAERLLMQNIQVKKVLNKALDKFFH